MQTAAGGPIKYISDMYQKLSDSPVASTIYDGTNLALYAASPFTGGITLIPAMAMTGLQAAGASANIYDKGLNFQNGIDIASAVPGFGLLNKGVKLAMKPTMKMVGKTTKRVKSATKYLPKKESRPYTYRRMERVGNSGSRRVIRPVEHTIELGRYHPTFWQLAKEDKKYWPAAALVYGEDAINHGLNTYQVIKDIDQKKQGGKINMIEFLKKGSGIHIKKENRGKFTSYCGGKVTDECIQKGKNSSNPAIRKRATFAANARKWKHKEGGLLKFEDGGKNGAPSIKFLSKQWFKNAGDNIGSFLNSDTGKGLLNIGQNILSGYTDYKNTSNLLDSQAEQSKASLEQSYQDIVQEAMKNRILKQYQLKKQWQQAYQNGETLDNYSKDIVAPHIGWDQYSSTIQNAEQQERQQKTLIDQQAKQAKSNALGNLFGGVVQSGFGILGMLGGGSSSSTTKTTTPKTTTNQFSSPLNDSTKFWSIK